MPVLCLCFQYVALLQTFTSQCGACLTSVLSNAQQLSLLRCPTVEFVTLMLYVYHFSPVCFVTLMLYVYHFSPVCFVTLMLYVYHFSPVCFVTLMLYVYHFSLVCFVTFVLYFVISHQCVLSFSFYTRSFLTCVFFHWHVKRISFLTCVCVFFLLLCYTFIISHLCVFFTLMLYCYRFSLVSSAVPEIH